MDEFNNLFRVSILAFTALFYCYYIASRFPKGILRLISILPIVYLFFILPLHLTSFHFRSTTCVFLVCFGNLKLLLFSFDIGPLSPLPSNVFIFIGLALLPVKLTLERQDTMKKETLNPPNYYKPKFLSFAAYMLVFALSLYSFLNYKNRMHPLVLLVVCVCVLIFELCIAVLIAEVVARAYLGCEILPLHNHPYLLTSLQDFWGNRWNPVVNNILRIVVFNPTLSVSAPVIGAKSASAASSLFTFVVSGLFHEILLFYISRVSPTWKMTWFFVVNGVFVTLEVAVKRAVRRRWRLHPAISGSLTLAFLAATVFWLYLPSIKANGMDRQIIGEVSILITFFADKIKTS